MAIVYDPPKSKAWKKEVIRQLWGQELPAIMLDGALKMSVTFYLPRPKSLPKSVVSHIKKPDCSNLVKGIEDAMTGLVYVDDSRIISLYIEKYYGEPRTIIRVWEVE